LLGILQRYTLREIAGPTLLGLLVFTFLLLVSELYRMADLLLNTSVTVFEALEMIACLLPGLFSLTIPMALMLGALLGLGRMASENEILAMRSGGVNLWRVYWPIIGVCAVISAVMVAANLWLNPALALRGEDLWLRVTFKLAHDIRPGDTHAGFAKDEEEAALSFRDRDPKTGELREVAVKLGNADKVKGQLTDSDVLITAPRGRIVPNMEDAAIGLELLDGMLHFRNQDPQRADEYDIVSFRRLTRSNSLDIGRRANDGTFKKDENMMSIGELRGFIADALRFRDLAGRVSKDELDRRIMTGQAPGWDIKDKYLYAAQMDLAQRFSIPLACVAVTLLAIPLAVYLKPSAKTLGFAIALGLTFTYYVLVQWGVKMGLSGSPWGFPMVFLPNLLLGGIGLILMWRSVRQ